MYYYIYDIFTNQKKYERNLQKIESKLADLGIQGRVCKLNVLKNLNNILEEIEANNIKNIIAVGNDQTVSKISSLLIDKNLVLGYIPIEPNSVIASIFGIDNYESACEIISKRKIAKIDVGKINGQYFLFSVESPTNEIALKFDKYKISPRQNNQSAGIYNINIDKQEFTSNPSDGKMEAVFSPRLKSSWFSWFKPKSKPTNNKSVFPITKVDIKHNRKPVMLIIDRARKIKTPVEIEVLKQKLKIIVGRDRMFE